MLVCIDTFDFYRGDDDLGIYRQTFDSLEEARVHAAKNLSVSGQGAKDVLAEVYDLEGDFEAQHAEDPKTRLARFLGETS
jgi:hypothetical protein